MDHPHTTALIHHPYRPPQGFDAVAPAVHKASTVIFPNVAALRARDWKEKTGYTYGLHGTPTSFTLEATDRRAGGWPGQACCCRVAWRRWPWSTWPC